MPDDLTPAEAAAFYVQSAYASMGREPPADMEFGLAVCLHWTAAGKAMPFKEWAKEFFGESEPLPEGAGLGENIQGDLGFKRITPEGIEVPITQGNDYR